VFDKFVVGPVLTEAGEYRTGAGLTFKMALEAVGDVDRKSD
jgi:hypothetical protein